MTDELISIDGKDDDFEQLKTAYELIERPVYIFVLTLLNHWIAIFSDCQAITNAKENIVLNVLWKNNVYIYLYIYILIYIVVSLLSQMPAHRQRQRLRWKHKYNLVSPNETTTLCYFIDFEATFLHAWISGVLTIISELPSSRQNGTASMSIASVLGTHFYWYFL